MQKTLLFHRQPLPSLSRREAASAPNFCYSSSRCDTLTIMNNTLTATQLVISGPHNTATTYKRSHHYPELDALRGLAAFVVVLGHYTRLWDTSTLSSTARVLLDKVFIIFFNGHCSVILFFLLSGFVLTLPYKRGNELPYRTFVLRRLARIYLPYLAALIVALLADWQLHRPMQVSVWFSKTWTAPLSCSLILQHILLIGNYNTAQVNTAFWSLAVEMRLSLLFPLLCIPLLRWNRRVAIAIFGTLVILDIATPHLVSHRLTSLSAGNVTDMTLGFVSFAVGILLARWLERAQAFWAQSGSTRRLLFFAVSIGLLGWLDAIGRNRLSFLENVLTVAGGCGVLIVTLCSRRASLVLNHRVPVWLGRVSYSLYLVHATVLFAFVHLFFGRLTRLQLLVPYLCSALAFAILFYWVIEKPSIRLSRSIGRSGRMLSNRPPGTVS
jgi:peptidoglycan/LPS O-acetylase OafA/YrhL